MLVIQAMNNKDFTHCTEKYLVTERFTDENETWDVPRLLFNNKDDADFYVENSDLSLMINTVKLLDSVKDLKVFKYLYIKYEQSTPYKLKCECLKTNNFDVLDANKLNSIEVLGDTVYIKKVIPDNFEFISDEEKIISICRKIFAYVKEKELYDSYKADFITITDESFKNEFLNLLINQL